MIGGECRTVVTSVDERAWGGVVLGEVDRCGNPRRLFGEMRDVIGVDELSEGLLSAEFGRIHAWRC